MLLKIAAILRPELHLCIRFIDMKCRIGSETALHVQNSLYSSNSMLEHFCEDLTAATRALLRPSTNLESPRSQTTPDSSHRYWMGSGSPPVHNPILGAVTPL